MSGTMLATRPANAERDSRAAAATRTVLVVDDDSGVRDLLRFILEEEGLVVETAENGYQGLARALYRRPSLVMLDLNIAFLSGEVVARELRSTYGDSLPIVLVSGNA
ncbi:MAG: response regulator transcription factor, partial [Chloroflexota bacterium]